MQLVPIQSVGELGLIKDIPPYNIPPNAWSDGNNVRFLDNCVKKAAGYQEVMDDCPFSPLYLYPYLTVGGTYWWIAFGRQKIAAWNGSTWTDVTRQTTNTLNGAITDVATTITLASAADFPTSGTIAIGSKQYGAGNDNYYEEIAYSGKSTNDLTGCTRGTDREAHDTGAVVTPVSTTYTADDPYAANTTDARWIVTDLNGIVVATNGADAPQYWPLNSSGEPDITVPFRELQNWPSATAATAGGSSGRCDAIRSFRTFLVGLNWVNPEDRVDNEPRLVKWSTEASYYSLPSTWDKDDATLDAGEYELADTPGDIIDGMAYGDSFFIYKDSSIYIMNYVGTPYIFSFKLLSPTIGLLSKGAIAEFEGGHFFMGNSDFYWNNGQTIKPLLSNKMRRAVYDELNGNDNNYLKCFVAADYVRNEMLACYPANSSNVVNRALIWNWKENTFSLRDLPDISHINSGIVSITTGTKWGAQATLNDASFTPLAPVDGGAVTVDTTVADPVFTSTGTLIIDDEQITYTGKTGTTFTGILRGANSTTAAAHDDDSVVNQYTDTWDSESGVWGSTNYDDVVKNLVFVRPGVKATITAATTANPVVITAHDPDNVTLPHGLSNDDIILIDYVVGMTELNGNTYTVAGATDTTFQLSGVDGSAYTAWSSGGEVLQPRIYRDNKGNKNDTETMTAYVERTGHDLGDPSSIKFVSAVYPKIEVSGDNTLNVWVGHQMSTEGAITWEGPTLFNPNSQSKVSCRISGKYFGVKIESVTDIDWKLHGVAFEVAQRGKRGGRMQ
jgi:hypothetical protein